MSNANSPIGERLLNRVDSRIVITMLDNLVWPILLLAFIVFSLLIPTVFASASNIEFLLYASAALGALVLAESLCLISGNFDLSIGSIAGFSAMFTALFMTSWFPNTPGFVGILIILAVGGFIGLLNGLSISVLGVNPFLQTLSFFIIFRGAVLILSTSPIGGLPGTYLFVGGGELFSIPLAVLLIIALFIIAWFVLGNTRTGLSIYAVGGDEQAAKEAGISTTKVIILVYLLSGVLSALAGLIYTGFISAATPTIAQDALFPAFAATVIGGISLFGGRGNILGAAGGVLLLGVIQAGLTMLNIDTQVVQTVNGLILLGAILLYTKAEHFRQHALSE